LLKFLPGGTLVSALREFCVKLCGKSGGVGTRGEILARKFIKKRGCSIVTCNWRFGRGEIDIIAEDSGILVFVEVRLRSKNAAVRGYESISKHKKDVLRRTCLAYLKKCAGGVTAHRFDVIDIEHDYETGGNVIRHYENVPLF
jgi:putative endonuclease